jgi:hypothetical protein
MDWPAQLRGTVRAWTATRCLKLARRYSDAQIIYSVADLHHLRLQAQKSPCW